MQPRILMLLTLVLAAVVGMGIWWLVESNFSNELTDGPQDSSLAGEEDGGEARIRRSQPVADGVPEQDGEPDEGSADTPSDPVVGQPVGCRVSGRVVDEYNEPVVGTVVKLAETGGQSIRAMLSGVSAESRRKETRTDSSGRFVLSGVPPRSRWELKLRHQTHCDLVKRVHVATRDVNMGDLALETGVVLRGIVLDDETGSPVEGALVSAKVTPKQNGAFVMFTGMVMPPKDLRSSTTNAEGVFEIAGFSPGIGTIYAEKTGFRPHRLRDIALDLRSGDRFLSMEEGSEVRINLSRGAALGGLVHDEEGNPIEGAHVTLRAMKPGDGFGGGFGSDTFGIQKNELVVQTDGDGRFSLVGLPGIKFNLLVEAPGFCAGDLADVEATGELDVELKRTGVAWGRLTDSITGEPVNGYTIMVRLRRLSKSDFFPLERLQRSSRARVLRGPEAARLAKVDPSENLFALTDIPVDSFEISIDAPGYVIRIEKEIQVDAGKIVEISTILDPESRISGSVVDHRGDPVVGAKVWVRPADPVEIARFERDVFEQPGRRRDEHVASDERGRFTMGRLAGMKYRLHASHGAHLDSPKQDVEPRTGEHMEDFVCELGASGTLVGTVFDSKGQVLAGGVVRVKSVDSPEPSRTLFSMSHRMESSADRNGRYEIEGLAPGEYTATLSPPLSGPSNRIRLEIFGGLPGGKSDPVRVTITAEKETSADLTMQASGQLTGVVTADGVPVNSVVLRLEGRGGSGFFPGPAEHGGQKKERTDGKGRYTFSSVAPGDYTLVVSAPGSGLPVRQRARVSSRQVTNLDIELPVGSIRGRVVALESGKPLEGIKVRISPELGERSAGPDHGGIFSISSGSTSESVEILSSSSFSGFPGSQKTVKTDEQGRYEFRHVAVGKFKVSISGGGVIADTRDGIEVAAGDALHDIDFKAARGARVTVEITWPDGDGEKFRIAFLRQEGKDPSEGVSKFVNGDDSAVFDGLLPGVYFFSLRDPAEFGAHAKPSEERVEVGSGADLNISLDAR